MAGCVDHPDFLDSQKVKTWESRCDGEAPVCFSGCAAREPVGDAVCRDSVWACASGVRDDLCCDPLNAPERCETWASSCDELDPCPGGYTCVKSRVHPVPASEGLCRLGELEFPATFAQCDDLGLIGPDLLPALGPAAIKVKGVVNSTVTCDDRRCSASDPCCQSCTGAYSVDLVGEDHAERLSITLRTESLACAGTNCGYSCAPLQPGRRYIVWGLFMPDPNTVGVGKLYYSGHCEP